MFGPVEHELQLTIGQVIINDWQVPKKLATVRLNPSLQLVQFIGID